MKYLKYLILLLLILFLAVSSYSYYLLKQQQPSYDGTITINGLQAEVEVLYDQYGVPHIYAQHETDAYKALGYVHAQDRLFQMELIRRIGRGTLSEILGPDLLKTDQLFRTLGIKEKAVQSAKEFLLPATDNYQKAALAYVDGINHFIQTGATPIEFTLLDIPKQAFEPSDLYLTIAYMAFGFAEGFRTDPIINKVKEQLGNDYIKDLATNWPQGTTTIPSQKIDALVLDSTSISYTFDQFAFQIEQILTQLPAPLLAGSNSWIVGGEKTESGFPILCNDTHIGYGQPAVWYEAHLIYPNNNVYGNFLAGYPFPPLGHTPQKAIGLTMLENDDVDFYKERRNPDDPSQIWYKNQWKKMEQREEVISIKGQADTSIRIFTSPHGPLVSGLFDPFNKEDDIAIYWTFLQTPCKLLEASYKIMQAQEPKELQEAITLISAPGLNIMYADTANNIAWFTSGHLIQRPSHINSAYLLDGSSGLAEPLGFHDPRTNPHYINPSNHYLYSANNQPESGTSNYYPGYYVPENRAKRINTLLQSKDKWNVTDMQKMIVDDQSSMHAQIAKDIMRPIKPVIIETRVPSFKQAMDLLLLWDGNHQLSSPEPTIYYKLQHYIFKYSMEDEIGTEAFMTLQKTFTFRRGIASFINNEASKWWDNINTKEKIETREMIFEKAFRHTVRDLKSTLGSDWSWQQVHTLEHQHPIGRQKPFNLLFNVGPFPIAGGNAVINNQGFFADTSGNYKVVYGPAMRKIVPLKTPNQAISVLPTGQSGNVMSPYYKDQATLFVEGKFRPQWIKRDSVVKWQRHRLLLRPLH